MSITRHEIRQLLAQGRSLLAAANAGAGEGVVRGRTPVTAWVRALASLRERVDVATGMALNEALAPFGMYLGERQGTTLPKLKAGYGKALATLDQLLRTHVFAPTPVDHDAYRAFLEAAIFEERLLESNEERPSVAATARRAELDPEVGELAFAHLVDEKLATEERDAPGHFDLNLQRAEAALSWLQRGGQRHTAMAPGAQIFQDCEVHMSNQTNVTGSTVMGSIATGDGATVNSTVTVTDSPLSQAEYKAILKKVEHELAEVRDSLEELGDGSYESFHHILTVMRKVQLAAGDMQKQQTQVKEALDDQEVERFVERLRSSQAQERAKKVLEALSVHTVTGVAVKLLTGL